MLRAVLDVNIWVANFLAAARGGTGTSCQLLIDTIIQGQCRLGPISASISLAMLETLEAVLEQQCHFPANRAHAARNIAEDAATALQSPLAVIGGGVQPMRDAEDSAVLEAALSANADLLITSHLRDFTRGSRSRLNATILQWRDTQADVLQIDTPRLPHGLIVASPFAAKAWLIDGHPPPPTALHHFRVP